MSKYLISGTYRQRNAQGAMRPFQWVTDADTYDSNVEMRIRAQIQAAGFQDISIRDADECSPFLTMEKPDNGLRDYPYLDRAAFAAALAPLIGATFTTDAESPRSPYAHVMLTGIGELRLSIDAPRGRDEMAKVTVRAWIPRAWHDLARAVGQIPDMPSATVDTRRPLAALAKDIKRRVIDASAAPLARVKEMVDAQSSRLSSLQASAAKLTAAFPNITVTIKGDAATTAEFYTTSDPSMHGILYQDGRICVQRIGGVDADKAMALFAALYLDVRHGAGGVEPYCDMTPYDIARAALSLDNARLALLSRHKYQARADQLAPILHAYALGHYAGRINPQAVAY
jgi:hypothetical protein